MCVTGKIEYVTASKAYKALASAQRSHKARHRKAGKPVESRTYLCDLCQKWHLTSRPDDNAWKTGKPRMPRGKQSFKLDKL